MIVEYVQYDLSPAQTEEFEAAYNRAGAHLTASADCLRWELRRCVEEPGRFIARIEWTSQEAHEEKWRRSAEFQQFLGEVTQFGAQRVHMAHWGLVGGGQER